MQHVMKTEQNQRERVYGKLCFSSGFMILMIVVISKKYIYDGSATSTILIRKPLCYYLWERGFLGGIPYVSYCGYCLESFPVFCIAP